MSNRAVERTFWIILTVGLAIWSSVREYQTRKASDALALHASDLSEGLQVFLRDPNVSLDNNGTERALCGIVLGRKNHYGSRSVRGTEVAAILYSLIESAKLAGVGPQTYLKTAITAALRGSEIPLPHEVA